jgi:hypothetical protein
MFILLTDFFWLRFIDPGQAAKELGGMVKPRVELLGKMTL